jgi:ABC-type branched-subunit amino acid transport system substrate-binding protein
MIRYYNDEDIIPGVKLKLDAYDTQFNPSRYSLGYDWCRYKGAQVVITIVADVPKLLKPFAARDKVVLAAMSGSQELFDPPGWVFGFSNTNEDSVKILLHWIRQNDWKEQGTPKIGMIYYNDTQSVDIAAAIEAYLHGTGEYDLVDNIATPVGTYAVESYAKKLKEEGCDYVAVPSGGVIFGPLLQALRAVGSKATLLDCCGSMGGFLTTYVQLVGWDLLDGQYSTANSFYWTDTASPIVQLAETLVQRYHSAREAQELIGGGNAYEGPAFMLTGILEILQQAVKNVGAKNFNGQAYYDAALNYKTTSSMWAGCPEFSFSETRRKLMDHSLITGFEKDVQNYVTLSDWLPDIVD